jgi:hypothetical protein
VFIYPNKTAKGGKFDCRSVNVQSLLDYRLDDNKESSFEVFLFAESFHEALDRNFAYTVYHTLNTALEKDAERTRRDEALTKVETPIETDEAATEEKPAENGAEVVEITENGDKVEKPEEKKSEEKKPEEKVDPRLEYRAVVSDVNTFMAFCHFDQNICG